MFFAVILCTAFSSPRDGCVSKGTSELLVQPEGLLSGKDNGWHSIPGERMPVWAILTLFYAWYKLSILWRRFNAMLIRALYKNASSTGPLSHYVLQYCVLDDWTASRGKPLLVVFGFVDLYSFSSPISRAPSRCCLHIPSGTATVSLFGPQASRLHKNIYDNLKSSVDMHFCHVRMKVYMY